MSRTFVARLSLLLLWTIIGLDRRTLASEPLSAERYVDTRPVVLVEHEIEHTSPFAAHLDQVAQDSPRFPAVPETRPATRWEPETRFEPAVRVERRIENRSTATRTVASVATPAPLVAGNPLIAAPGTVTYHSLPIAGGAASSAPALAIPASGPWPPTAWPAQLYAIGGVNPRVPPPRIETRYLAKSMWGESKYFVGGQPVRNFGRFLLP